MAGGTTDYHRGEMEINGHAKTYTGFMAGSVYGGALIAIILLYPIMIFGAGLGWVTALIITLVLGIIIGMALKLKGAWYGLLIGYVFFAGFLSLVLNIFIQ